MNRVRTFTVAAVCAVGMLGVIAGSANATILFSVQPILVTDPVTVGQTGLPGSIILANDSTAPNNDSGVEVEQIRFTPSCNGVFAVPPCPSPEPGVITASATATGAAGSQCAGINFPFAVTDNATGEILVAIPPGTFTLPSGSECRINFTYTVVKSPATDSQPGEPGVQTDQNLRVRFNHPDSLDLVVEIGSDFTTINPAAVPTPPGAVPPVTTPTPKKKCKKAKKRSAVAAKKCKKRK
jgi:hypothetical protein